MAHHFLLKPSVNCLSTLPFKGTNTISFIWFRYLFHICQKILANVFESTFNYTICLLKSIKQAVGSGSGSFCSVFLSSQCVYVYLPNLLCSSCQITGLRSQLLQSSCAIVDVFLNKGQRISPFCKNGWHLHITQGGHCPQKGRICRASQSPSYSNLRHFGSNEPLAEINSQTIYRFF